MAAATGELLMTVAVLCAARNSVYHQLDCVEVYDQDRDARTFPGGMPVIAHPPCRSWSAFCRHQAKPEPGEQELGLWCAEQVKTWGGILEQPAHSHLFEAAGLPLPDEDGTWDSYSIRVDQSWWGYPLRKKTWLYLSHIPAEEIDFPYRLHERRGDRRRQQVMSKNQRSATHPDLARWFVNLAELAWQGIPYQFT